MSEPKDFYCEGGEQSGYKCTAGQCDFCKKFDHKSLQEIAEDLYVKNARQLFPEYSEQNIREFVAECRNEEPPTVFLAALNAIEEALTVKLKINLN